jgi:hypothetical protein
LILHVLMVGGAARLVGWLVGWLLVGAGGAVVVAPTTCTHGDVILGEVADVSERAVAFELEMHAFRIV